MEKVNHVQSQFKGRFTVGDPFYLEQLMDTNTPDAHEKRLKQLIFTKDFKTLQNVDVAMYKDSDGDTVAIVTLWNSKLEKPQVKYVADKSSIAYLQDARMTHKELGCDTACFTLINDKESVEVSTLADGFYGDVYSTKDTTLIMLIVDADAISLEQLQKTLTEILKLA